MGSRVNKIVDELIEEHQEYKCSRDELLEIGKIAVQLDPISIKYLIESMKNTLELSKIKDEIEKDDLVKDIKTLTISQRKVIKEIIKEFK